jgi:hypothetical protein
MRSLIVCAVIAAAAAFPSHAQRAGAPSDLGSPPEAAGMFSTDYRALVSAALPRVSPAELARLVKQVQREADGGIALAVGDVNSWTSLFGLRDDSQSLERTTELVDAGNASYLADPQAGRFYVTLRHADEAPVPREQFAKTIPDIRRAHQALAGRIGIPAGEIFFVDFRETLAQSTPQSRTGEPDLPIESAGATTTLLRAVGGLMVDGSHARMSSLDAARFEMVDVRWPAMRLVPEVERKGLVYPGQLMDRIAGRIAATAGGRPVNVLMAVVLRPIAAGHGFYFVPSLRVGVAPKSEPMRDGFRTEAGERFYIDLIEGMEAFGDRDEREAAPENQERLELQ